MGDDMHRTHMTLIQTRSLSRQFTHCRIDFADVDVPAGGVLLLRGPSGSGKSTWMSLVSGLRRPSAGEVRVAGHELSTLPAAQLDAWRGHHVGLLPQRLHLSDALPVWQNLTLAFVAGGMPVDAPAIDAALRALGLAHLARRMPHELSGGEAQRVALARAVLRRPALLLADEPTASLDDEAAAAALDLLLGQAAACAAGLVVATHDQRAIQALRSARPDLAELVLARPRATQPEPGPP